MESTHLTSRRAGSFEKCERWGTHPLDVVGFGQQMRAVHLLIVIGSIS
jgi:hypothetical protein